MKTINRILKSLVLISLFISHLAKPYDDIRKFKGHITIKNFKSLFNQFRVASPKNIPWAGSYWGHVRDGIAYDETHGQDSSPAYRYDRFFELPEGKGSYEWEKARHSCSPFKEGGPKANPKTFEGCSGWWGHCNAWSAAAIWEPEPRSDKEVIKGDKKFTFTVADQKAYLTELYMGTQSIISGRTDKSEETGPWIWNPFDKKSLVTGKWDAFARWSKFWDVSPRTFFLIFTNYVGLRKMGVVIDRFTGDQVWNQPIAGYRFLPIRRKDLHPAEVPDDPDPSPFSKYGGRKLYPVTLRVKIYWAEDGVHGNTVSDPFDIQKTKDEEKVETHGKHSELGEHYTGRYLQFKLFFDSPVDISTDGKKVLKAGKIIGDGIWHHHEVEGEGYENLDETHPDFIWFPLQLDDRTGKKNIHITEENVRYIQGEAEQSQLPTFKKKVKYYFISNMKKSLKYADSFPLRMWNQEPGRTWALNRIETAFINQKILIGDLSFKLRKKLLRKQMLIKVELLHEDDAEKAEKALNKYFIKYKGRPGNWVEKPPF